VNSKSLFFANLQVIKYGMAKTLIQTVVKHLQHERARLEDELHRVTAALTTFGKVYMQGGKRGPGGAKLGGAKKTRTISAAGRKRIAAAQRARWAKVRAGKTGKAGKK
jgi:hypothetical protein